MPAITPPNQTTIDTWNIKELGVRDGTSPVESYEVNASRGVRKFRCDWADRFDVIKWFIGYSEQWDDAGTKRITRQLPQTHPNFTGWVATKILSCKGYQWTGNEDTTNPYIFTSTQMNKFTKAELEVQYEHVLYESQVSDTTVYSSSEMDRYVIRGEVTPSAEYLQLPGATFKYIRSSGSANPHGVAIPYNSGRVIPQEKFTLTWHRLPEEAFITGSILYERIYGDGSTRPYLGTVNTAEFYGRPVGTVLFSGVRPMLRLSPLGYGLEWDIEYTFDYDPYGWLNKYYFGVGGTTGDNGFYFVGKGSTHYTAATVPDDYSIYDARNLNNLFSVN